MTLTEDHVKLFSERLEFALENVSPTLAKAASDALDRRTFDPKAPFACEYHKRLDTKTKEVVSNYMQRAEAVVDQFLQSSATERFTHDDKATLLGILDKNLDLGPFERCADSFEERLITLYKSLGVSVTVGVESNLKRNASRAGNSLRHNAHNSKRNFLKTIDFTLRERTFDSPAATETNSVDSISSVKMTENKKLETKGGESVTTGRKPNIFVVHGHDSELHKDVQLWLHSLSITPIVLAEEANSGQTVIEKFEAHAADADTGYAIVLFTADDVGRSIAEGEIERPRARQNVVFEAGYFYSQLGRSRTAIVVSDGVELPSDIQGVVYTNTSDWKAGLQKELVAAGLISIS